MKMKRLFSILLCVTLLLGAAPWITPQAAATLNENCPVLSDDKTYYEISTGEQLKEVLTAKGIENESWYQQGVNEFHLIGDIEIDTSDFDTTYVNNVTSTINPRRFSGTLDGNGHTITVVDAGGEKSSQPLFDYIEGASSNRAVIKNLNVVFNGDVSGTTVAAIVQNTDIDSVKITFKKDIELKKVDANYTIASGMVGFVTASDCTFSNIQVIADPESAEYGTIGSLSQSDAVDTPYGMAAGLFVNSNAANATILSQNVTITVSNIGVYSKNNSSSYTGNIVCAAGAVAESEQGQSRLKEVTVHVTGNIEAGTTPDGATHVRALGLCRYPYAVYDCHVTVDGDIFANYQGSSAVQTGNTYYSGEAVASGLCWQMCTDSNAEELNADSVSSSVLVKGDIKSIATNAKAVACGATKTDECGTIYKDIKVEVNGEISAENTGSGSAYASGFSYNSTGKTVTGQYDRSDCTVSASKISAEAVDGDAIAAGFAVYDFIRSEKCTVDVGTISAKTTDQASDGCSYAAGFSFYTCTYYERDAIASENCSVTVDMIQAEGRGNNGESVASGFACAANAYGYTNVTHSIKHCSVEISKEISADDQTGLFIAQNFADSLIGNTVTLPKSSASITSVTEKDGVTADHMRFTASENDGRAASYPNNAWEFNNTVLTDSKRYPVSCDHDDGDTVNSTLWRLGVPEIVSYTVNYVDETGSVYKSETVPVDDAGNYTVIATYPSKDGYTFAGWKDSDDKTYQANEAIDLITVLAGENTTLTLTVQWSKNSSGGGGGGGSTRYTLTYESNGGTSYSTTTHTSGTVVKLDKTPTRTGYTFTGWYEDKRLTDKIIEIKMTSNKTVYAGWENVTDLNSKDHIAYIIGYSDGLSHPADNITRGQVATVLFRLLDADRRDAIFITSNSFNDVNHDKWYNNMVSSMANGGYIYGYTDGDFGGDNSITRAEFVAMLVRFIGVDNSATASFSDLNSSHWAYQYIATASSAGWIQGFSDGTFRPNQRITRAEAMTILNRVLNRGVDADSTLPDGYTMFEDNSFSAWYYYDVIEATNDHEYTGSRPSENWSSLDIEYEYDMNKYERS